MSEHRTDLQRTEKLAPGDLCEFRYPARTEWHPGRVVRNGGPAYWHIEDRVTGKVGRAFYIEHVRAVGTDPWGAGAA